MTDVVILRRESVVTLVQGQTQAPIISQQILPSVVIQRDGVPGSSAGAAIEYDQVSPSATWTVNHNLGAKPSSVMVLSSGGREIEADLLHTSDNQLVLYFSTPQSGSVRISP